MTNSGAAPASQLAEDAPVQAEIELTILMPCLNEAETIGDCVRKATQFLHKHGVSGEVVIADNGSTDGSIAIAESLGARVVPVPTRGYGAALIGGIAAARGRYVIMGDADDSYDFSNLSPFLDELRRGSDLVMGNRFLGGIEPGAMPFLHRYLGNPVLSFLGRLFFKIPVGDFHCGLRGFRRSSIADLNLTSTGMEFASEMVVRTSLRRLAITEVATTLKPDGRSRAPHLKTWRDGWRHLKFLLIYSPKWLFFYPGAVLIVLGLILGAALIGGPLAIGPSIVLDLNSFLTACMATIIGVQLITLGALARTYATLGGLLPPGPRSNRIAAFFKTDRLVWIAAGLVVFGAGLFGTSLLQWGWTGFGSLPSPLIPRLVAAGLSTMAIGVQTGFTAFLFDVISYGRMRG